MTQLDTILQAIQAETPELTELRRKNAKEQIKQWAKELVDRAYPDFNDVPEGTDEVDWFHEQVLKSIEEA